MFYNLGARLSMFFFIIRKDLKLGTKLRILMIFTSYYIKNYIMFEIH